MAKNIDGVYDQDPRLHQNAKRYQKLSYETCVLNKLKVCDQSAFILAEEFGLTMYLYDGKVRNVILDIVNAMKIGTLIKRDCIDEYY